MLKKYINKLIEKYFKNNINDMLNRYFASKAASDLHYKLRMGTGADVEILEGKEGYQVQIKDRKYDRKYFRTFKNISYYDAFNEYMNIRNCPDNELIEYARKLLKENE